MKPRIAVLLLGVLFGCSTAPQNPFAAFDQNEFRNNVAAGSQLFFDSYEPGVYSTDQRSVAELLYHDSRRAEVRFGEGRTHLRFDSLSGHQSSLEVRVHPVARVGLSLGGNPLPQPLLITQGGTLRVRTHYYNDAGDELMGFLLLEHDTNSVPDSFEPSTEAAGAQTMTLRFSAAPDTAFEYEVVPTDRLLLTLEPAPERDNALRLQTTTSAGVPVLGAWQQIEWFRDGQRVSPYYGDTFSTQGASEVEARLGEVRSNVWRRGD